MQIDWKGKIWQWVLEIKERMKDQGLTHPTIRTFWYRGWDTYRIFPGTEQTYKKLDALIVEMRKAGAIEFGYFPVERGKSYGGDCALWSVDEYINALKNQLLNAHEDYRLPRWLGQPVIVEVWVEKVGHGPQIRDWVWDLKVDVRANQGYGTWEFVFKSMQDLKAKLEQAPEGTKVVIIYLGDLDPSGTDMDRALEEAMQFFGVEPQFIRLAVNPGQIREYSLPEWPEKRETLEKIENDPRYRKYLEKFGKVACELDSFMDKAPEALRELLRSELQKHFNEKIYAEVIKEEKRRRAQIRKIVEKLTAEWISSEGGLLGGMSEYD